MRPSAIADHYVPEDRLAQTQPEYPLDLYLCLDCGHVQNIDVVDPSLLFRDYHYKTSSSLGLVEHYRRYATEVTAEAGAKPGALVVEIGSNDGSLLGFFKQQGLRVLGVDPAVQIAASATQSGVPTIPEFFTEALARRIVDEHGPAEIVAANNVFAHADDLGDITRGIATCLSKSGMFVFEVSYLTDIVDRFLFDTVYHEHVSYHSIRPLAAFFERNGLMLIDVRRNQSKGGSIRGYAQRLDGTREPAPVVQSLIDDEHHRGLDSIDLFRRYAEEIARRKLEVVSFIDAERAAGRVVAGYGASTTVTTLLAQFDLASRIDFLADDNPQKAGLFSPGAHLPVVPSEALYERRPDVVVILAWNYATLIIRKHERFLREGRRFLIPLPQMRVIGAAEYAEFAAG